jgi:putative flippase GtrA
MMEKIFKYQTDSVSVQAFRYFLAGTMAYAIDYSTLVMLTNVFKLHYLLSAAIAFMLGAITSYVLNITWVFDGRTLKNKYLEASIFFTLVISGLILNHYLILFFTEYARLHYLVSKLISTVAVGWLNFCARKYILFR